MHNNKFKTIPKIANQSIKHNNAGAHIRNESPAYLSLPTPSPSPWLAQYHG